MSSNAIEPGNNAGKPGIGMSGLGNGRKKAYRAILRNYMEQIPAEEIICKVMRLYAGMEHSGYERETGHSRHEAEAGHSRHERETGGSGHEAEMGPGGC